MEHSDVQHFEAMHDALLQVSVEDLLELVNDVVDYHFIPRVHLASQDSHETLLLHTIESQVFHQKLTD